MLAMTAGEAANVCDGMCIGAREQRFVGVSTDTRTLVPSRLFVALKGERFDGHDHIAAATAAGAAVTLVARSSTASVAQVVVADPLAALQKLSQNWRSRFSIPFIALTGSNGKTTVKEMLRAIFVKHFQQGDTAVLATIGNLNNHIGVPLTLARLGDAHRVAVIETGMNHLGEIRALTQLIAPDVALINNAGPAHLEGVGDLDGVARAKGELLEGLPAHGIAVLNQDDVYYAYWAAQVTSKQTIIGFGTSPAARIRGTWQEVTAQATMEIADAADGSTTSFTFPLVGHHNRLNALAAAATARALGISLGEIGDALSGFSTAAGRQHAIVGNNGAQVIDDTYNANPASMRAAIATLASYPGQKIIALGQMAELGTASEALHQTLGGDIARSETDLFFATGERMRAAVDACNAIAPKATWFASREALTEALYARLAPNVVVLVKGSRSSAMEYVVDALRADEVAPLETH